MPIYRLGDLIPKIDPDAYVHPDAVVIGDVTIGPQASVWPGAILRADYGSIYIGHRTSVQDGTVIHCTRDYPTVIGSSCVIGHLAHLEGCTVADRALVGSGSVILHRATIGYNSLVGAHATVTNGSDVPAFSLALGTPARITRDRVIEGQFDEIVERYVQNARLYQARLERFDPIPPA